VIYSRFVLLSALCALTFARESFAQATYNNMRPLVNEVISANGDTIRGYVTGPIADKLAETFGAAPVEVEARAIANFQSPDCKRVEIKFIRRDVITPQGPTDAILSSQFNICRDGLPPTEGMDFSLIAPMLTPSSPIPSDFPKKR
jgi:hypothetical protein